ncbi:hypothetical protein POPTR_002G048450v4 [Populus trichocarpa]|uniref:Uncharacterized protein n=1 Tax=Populus trichocarpa TaxID=3694 RepID=A0ACC0TC34_POPTR|nr:hypothetical protein POPTR_002G048450v4 [Populus trichocarpa]
MEKGLNSRVQEWQRVVGHHHPGIILDFPPWLKFRQGKCVVGSDSPALVINEERRRRQQTSKSPMQSHSKSYFKIIWADLMSQFCASLHGSIANALIDVQCI